MGVESSDAVAADVVVMPIGSNNAIANPDAKLMFKPRMLLDPLL
jgi:hypothetical protein